MNENVIIGGGKLIYENAKLFFAENANNNHIYIPLGQTVKLKNCSIHFFGSNNLIYFCHNVMSVNVSIYNDSTLYIGPAFSTNKTTNIIISEQTSVFIGKENLYSFDVWFRTADPHLIYDCETRKRINPSKSIFIGDHVWIGQDCLIMKNTFIGSGSIIGAKSVCSNKIYDSNSSYGGYPAKKLKDGVFFTKDCVHNYKETETELSLIKDTDAYTFTECFDPQVQKPHEIISFLDSNKDMQARIDYLTNLSTSKNRFYLRNEN